MCSIFKIPVCPLHECLVYWALLASKWCPQCFFHVNVHLCLFQPQRTVILRPGTLCSAREPQISYVFWPVEAAVRKAEGKVSAFQLFQYLTHRKQHQHEHFYFPFSLSLQLSSSLLWEKKKESNLCLTQGFTLMSIYRDKCVYKQHVGFFHNSVVGGSMEHGLLCLLILAHTTLTFKLLSL